MPNKIDKRKERNKDCTSFIAEVPIQYIGLWYCKSISIKIRITKNMLQF